MKRFFVVQIMLVSVVTILMAQLRFNNAGEFKIVQFTDIHYNGSEQSKVALGVIDSVLTAENPDLVILTGDIATGRPAEQSLLAVLNRVSKFGHPFVYEFGNHDWEQGLSNRELYAIARQVPNALMPNLDDETELDHILKIQSHDGKKTAAAIYCMDSHAYPAKKGRGTYAWLTPEQVMWYKAQSKKLSQENDGAPLPALAFFHIPVPEFHDAVKNERATFIGNRRETVCSPEYNTGMFTAMSEAGDVMAIFVGHDHDNDYTVMWHNILLGYGRFSGGNTVYNNLPCGARVIVLHEGERRFHTYIRERKGNVLMPSVYPDSYIADEWEKRPLEKW